MTHVYTWHIMYDVLNGAPVQPSLAEPNRMFDPGLGRPGSNGRTTKNNGEGKKPQKRPTVRRLGRCQETEGIGMKKG